MTFVAVDSKEREQAVDPRRSWCITAPAGSGKTELLTQRLLALLACVDNPEEVLAITFTRKAVAEMRVRVLDALLDAKNSDLDQLAPHRRYTLQLAQAVLERNKQLGWQLLDNPGRLRLFTFDAFAAWLVSQMPVSSRFGGRASLHDEPVELYNEAVDDLLQDLDSQRDVADDLASLLDFLDCRVEQLHGLLVSLLARRDQWRSVFSELHRGDDAKVVLQEFFEKSVTAMLVSVRNILQPYQASLCELMDFAAGNVCDAKPEHAWHSLIGIERFPEATAESLPIWHCICDFLLTTTDSFRKTVNKNQGFLPKSTKPVPQFNGDDFKQIVGELKSAELLAALIELRNIPVLGYDQENWPMLEALMNVLHHLLARLELVFQSHKAVDFSAISLQALEALGAVDEPSELALRLDYQVKHILVDEFQDTSTVQFDLLSLLTREWDGSDKTLFVVGDAMQSVYAFRNARVGLFMAARQFGVGDVALTELALKSNFRSSAQVVDWVNTQFSSIFPAQDDLRLGAARFVEAVAVKPSQVDAGVQAFRYAINPDNPSIARVVEAQKICDLLMQCTGSSAILIRNRSQAQHIIPVLRAAGVPWTAAELDRLSDQPCIVDMMSLTRMLLNPADRIAWLSLLRSPLLRLSLEELLCLATQADVSLLGLISENERWQALPAQLRERLNDFRDSYVQVWQQRQRKGLPTVVAGLWQALGGEHVYSSDAEISYRERYLDKLREICQRDAQVDWLTIERQVATLYAGVTDTRQDAVEIMTVHKSKGLEFDNVFLPCLDKAGRGDDGELLSWFDPIDANGNASLMLGLNAQVKDVKDMYSYVRFLKKQQIMLESKRLLYVACTRAVKNLYLFTATKVKDDGQVVLPSKNSLASSIWPDNDMGLAQLTACEELHYLASASPMNNSTPRPTARQRLDSTSLLEQFRGFESDDESRPEPLSNHLEKSIGTVVHRCLQAIVDDGFQTWLSCDLLEYHQRWLTQLRQQGIQTADLNDALAWVIKAVENTLADSDAHWIFNASEASASELAITTLASGKAFAYKDYIIDRTFKDSDGTRWIVDYKTVLQVGVSIPDFLALERDRYSAQLQDYKRAFIAAGESQVRIGLYYPLQQLFDELA